MEEITADELYEGLLGYGLFTSKLPPIFTSAPFFALSKSISKPYEDMPKGFVYFESIRDSNIPRALGIPVPFAYQKLCKILSDNWDNIKLHFKNTTNSATYKISRIHIRKKNDSKALFEMNYNNWRLDGTPENDFLLGKKYLVKSDISTCFPSIYTHSIPWALMEKSVAKVSRDKSLWQNQIDHYCQNMKSGETHGLLIGPHSSNLISEIILTCVDKELYNKNWRYTRNIDDYSCYVETYEEAQRFLKDLTEELRKFDLPLNHKKTVIEELPIASSKSWVRQLTNSPIFSKEHVTYKDARSYLDLAVTLMEMNEKNSAILNYAVKVLGKLPLSENAKELCRKTVMHYAIIYQYLIPLLDEHVFIAFSASLTEIEAFSNKAYEDGYKNNNFEEMYYSIFFSIKYGFKISKINSSDIIKNDSCILKIFAWLYYKKFTDTTNLDILKDEAVRLSLNDFDENWLFCYEALNQNELKSDWKFLKKNKISFIIDEYRI